MSFFGDIWSFVSGTGTGTDDKEKYLITKLQDPVLVVHMTLFVEQEVVGNVIFLICGLHQKKLQTMKV